MAHTNTDDKPSHSFTQDPSSLVSTLSTSCDEAASSSSVLPGANTFRELSMIDRLLTPLILLVMIGGVLIGVYVPGVRRAFSTAMFNGVSAPIAVGLIIMMWPVLTKVQYELLPQIFRTRRLWVHICWSILLNWIYGPFLMLGLAWATLPDLPEYRTGVIMVGLARCIAMVMIWNHLARGNHDYCATIVVLNSVLQIVLYAPLALLFVNIMGNGDSVRIAYGNVAMSVLIYLGIPLVAGVVTRYSVMSLAGRHWFEQSFLPVFSPLALLGLLYTITVMFAYQGHRIVDDLGAVFRVFVPMILYFSIMWSSTFALMCYLSRTKGERIYGYEMAIVQSFTAASNNFELAIAVCIAVWGVDSEQALAATIGPLVEVPVLLALTWASLYLRRRLAWTDSPI